MSSFELSRIQTCQAQKMLAVQCLMKDAVVPTRGSTLAAGYDLYCSEDVVLMPGLNRVRTGVAIAVPEGTYGRIADRSSMALKSLHVMAGVIDADYRGEVVVIIFNHSNTSHTFGKGSRVAQLILEKIVSVPVIQVTSLDNTDRGESGFGSTGV